MGKFVSIIIPTYHDWGRLQLCINAIVGQTYPKEGFEVIIVNNDPQDVPPAAFCLPEHFRLINSAKPGSYAARNAGLQVAKGEIIGFTDSDCIPDKNWLLNAVNYLAQNPTCSRLAGHIAIIYKKAKPTIAELYNTLYCFPQKWHAEKIGTSVTANLFTYKHVFDEVGVFNDTLMSLGDSKWAHLARKAGHQVHYVADVIVNHPARNLYELIRKEMRHGGGDGLLRRKITTKPSFYKFLTQLKPHPRELRFIKAQGKGIGLAHKIVLLIIRQFAVSMRFYESYRVQKGKDPIRD